MKQSKPITLFWIISKEIWGILWRIYANSCWLSECWYLYFLFLIFRFNFAAAIFFSAAAPWTLLSMRLCLRLQRGTNRWQRPRQCYHPHARTCTINQKKRIPNNRWQRELQVAHDSPHLIQQFLLLIQDILQPGCVLWRQAFAIKSPCNHARSYIHTHQTKCLPKNALLASRPRAHVPAMSHCAASCSNSPSSSTKLAWCCIYTKGDALIELSARRKL